MGVLPLAALGQCIWITGPSAGGKSTLATAVGAKLNREVIHLDQLRFRPSTWDEREDGEFLQGVTRAAAGESWVIEGNYFSFLGGRLERATGMISLSSPRLGNYGRYLSRSLGRSKRVGTVAGAGEGPNWPMTKWILLEEPRGRERKRQMLLDGGKPVVLTSSFAELKALYRAWEL